MNVRTLRTIAIKDLKEVLQNKGVLAPIIVIPMLFLAGLPLALILIPTLIPEANAALFASPQGFSQFDAHFAPILGDRLAGLNAEQAWIVLTTGYMLAPFLLIMPLMVSTIIGAESFAGERERKTLEALIYTPATDSELFVGKVLASVIPAVILAWVGFIIYGVAVNLASWPVMGRVWFPPETWWPLMLWLTPALATLGMSATVLISVRVRTFMEAYQASGSLVILVLGLVLGQLSGVLFLSVGVTLLLGLALWVVDALLIRFAIAKFARASLLSRL